MPNLVDQPRVGLLFWSCIRASDWYIYIIYTTRDCKGERSIGGRSDSFREKEVLIVSVFWFLVLWFWRGAFFRCSETVFLKMCCWKTIVALLLESGAKVCYSLTWNWKLAECITPKGSPLDYTRFHASLSRPRKLSFHMFSTSTSECESRPKSSGSFLSKFSKSTRSSFSTN